MAGRPAMVEALDAAGLPSDTKAGPRAAVDAVVRAIVLSLLHPAVAEPGRLPALAATAANTFARSAGAVLFSPEAPSPWPVAGGGAAPPASPAQMSFTFTVVSAAGLVLSKHICAFGVNSPGHPKKSLK